MSRFSLVVVAVIVGRLAVPHVSMGQGTLYLSNLGQTPAGSADVAGDHWIAQAFTTGTNFGGYLLNSVDLLMNPALGTPNGFTGLIYSSPGNGAPGTQLGILSGSDPAAGGLVSYTASGLILAPSTFYYVVLTATTPGSQGGYRWSAVDSFGRIFVAPGDPWSIPDFYYTSANGSSWSFNARQNVFQLGLTATAIPEPGSLGFLIVGYLVFQCPRTRSRGWHRRC